MPSREERREAAIKRRLARSEKMERELEKLTPAQRHRKIKRYKRGSLHIVNYINNVGYFNHS